MIITCADCRHLADHHARGLCRTCYRRHYVEGTVGTFPLTPPSPSGPVADGSTNLLTVIDGVSYRQLDHWVRCGYLRPENALPGSGVSRLWTAAEAEVARTMGRLVTAGFTPKLAHRVARARQARLELAPGVFVEVAA